MLKALFLDLDETLCDTTGANLKARDHLADKLKSQCKKDIDYQSIATDYLTGIYKVFTPEMKLRFLPIDDEEEFRTDLLKYLFEQNNLQNNYPNDLFHELRIAFDDFRINCFDFFPGVESLISDLRKEFKLVVITNGPIYSQHPKVRKVKLREKVDHVIIGGEEPEEKPYKSIFMKACRLADCEPEHAIHIGDSLSADIAGASNSGIKNVWINPKLENDPLPDHTISNFIHIRSVLDSYK